MDSSKEKGSVGKRPPESGNENHSESGNRVQNTSRETANHESGNSNPRVGKQQPTSRETAGHESGNVGKEVGRVVCKVFR